MPKRSGVIHGVKDILSNLQKGRDSAIAVVRQAKIASPEYAAAQASVDAIDNLAETLTGDRKFFYVRGHGGGVG